jgi:four helix bundle protein
MENKIKFFTDLDVWKEGHKLVIEIYKTSKKFPRSEIFGLTDQMRRAAVSVTSNIAEGFGRDSYKEKSHFYSMASGSLTEVQNQLIIARDVGYINDQEFDRIMGQSAVVSRICRGLIKSTRNYVS